METFDLYEAVALKLRAPDTNLASIARDTEISRKTLERIANKKGRPKRYKSRYETLQTIENWFLEKAGA